MTTPHTSQEQPSPAQSVASSLGLAQAFSSIPSRCRRRLQRRRLQETLMVTLADIVLSREVESEVADEQTPGLSSHLSAWRVSQPERRQLLKALAGERQELVKIAQVPAEVKNNNATHQPAREDELGLPTDPTTPPPWGGTGAIASRIARLVGKTLLAVAMALGLFALLVFAWHVVEPGQRLGAAAVIGIVTLFSFLPSRRWADELPERAVDTPRHPD